MYSITIVVPISCDLLVILSGPPTPTSTPILNTAVESLFQSPQNRMDLGVSPDRVHKKGTTEEVVKKRSPRINEV